MYTPERATKCDVRADAVMYADCVREEQEAQRVEDATTELPCPTWDCQS